jgi:soluble lytic murein transglycosylase-like protein
LLPIFLALCVGSPVAGAPTPKMASPASLPAQLNEPAPCVKPAAEYHGVNPWILLAILKVESNFSAAAVNRNNNGTLDIGMAQINSVHFAKLSQYGITPTQLMDGCVSTYVAAWHLRQQIAKYGNTWFGVAAYHSASPCLNQRYGSMLWNVLVGWGVIADVRVPVRSLASCGVRSPVPGPSAPSITNSVAFDETK